MTINSQSSVVNTGLVLQLDGANNTAQGHFDDATIWKNIIGNDNDGNINGATWNGNALLFDGLNDWVNLGEINSNYQTLEVTFSVDGIPGKNVALISNYESGGGGLSISSDGYIQGEFCIGGNNQLLVSNVKVVPNEIYNATLSYDGNDMIIYVNGIAKNKSSINSSTISPTVENTVMSLGCNPKGSVSEGQFFGGKIYSARVYNRALNDSEIRQNYQSDQILVNGYAHTDNLEYTFIWDEAVTGFTKDDISVSNAGKGTFTEVTQNKVYKLNVITPDEGLLETERITVSVPEEVCVDKNSTYNIASEIKSIALGTASTTKNNETRVFASLQKAIDAANSDTATVKLLHEEIHESVTVENTQKITLDLNGNNLISDNAVAITNDGSLNIKETSGSIIATGTADAIVNAGTLTLGTDDFELSEYGPNIIGANYGINSSGTVNFYDGEIKGATGKSITSSTLTPAKGCSIKKTTTGGIETATLEQKYVNITVDLNDGKTAPVTTSEKYLSRKPMQTPTREGYTFGGWVPTQVMSTKSSLTSNPSNATWVELFYHYSDSGKVLFADNSEASFTNSEYKFSILNQLESFRKNTSSSFEFLLNYDELPGEYNRWKQTSNPTNVKATIVGVSESSNSWKTLRGYPDWAGGLALTSEDGKTFLDGCITWGSDWWYSIGSQVNYNNGSPGPDNTVIKGATHLWVKAENDLSNIKTPIYGILDEDGNYIVKHDITLKALWIPGVDVKIDPNGGSYNNSTNITTVNQAAGTNLTLSTPTREGYTFGGWVPTKVMGNDNSTWVEIFYHNNNEGTILFDNDEEVQLTNTKDKYSIIRELEKFRDSSNSNFEFMLTYDELNGYNRWSQKSNPLTYGENQVDGYQQIQLSWINGSQWNGLSKCSSNDETFLSGANDANYAIGAKKAYNGGIRGPVVDNNLRTITGGMHLWIKTSADLSTITDEITGVLDSNGKYLVKYETTLKANWIPNCTLSIDPNGGTLNGSTSIVTTKEAYGSKKTIGTPTRDGYMFGGWVPTKVMGTDNSTWVEVFYHNNQCGTVMFSGEAEAKSANTRDKFSILGQLEKFRANTNTNFEFLLNYDQMDGYQRWTQRSNPTTTTASVNNYNSVSISWGVSNWNGMAISSDTTRTFIDGSPSSDTGNWFFSIGAYQAWYDGIAGPNRTIEKGTYLWVKSNANLSNITEAVTGVLDNNNQYTVRHDITLKAVWLPVARTMALSLPVESSSSSSMSTSVSTPLASAPLKSAPLTLTSTTITKPTVVDSELEVNDSVESDVETSENEVIIETTKEDSITTETTSESETENVSTNDSEEVENNEESTTEDNEESTSEDDEDEIIEDTSSEVEIADSAEEPDASSETITTVADTGTVDLVSAVGLGSPLGLVIDNNVGS